MNTGWGWSQFSSSEIPFGVSAVNDITPQVLKMSTSGPLLGGQIGYNFTDDSVLLGFEADVDGAGINGNTSSSAASIKSSFTGLNGFTHHQNTSLLATARGRIGHKFSFFNQHSGLIYFTGGYAYRQVTNNVAATGNVVGNWSSFLINNFTNAKSGYALGAGLEWKIASNWSVRSEYMFYGLNHSSTTMGYFSYNQDGSGVNIATSTDNINSIRFGINYLF
jgi:outer membrane immunogenic protein